MEFKTKITTKELFQFMMKHTYAGFSGKIGLVISFASAILFIQNVSDFEGNETKVVILGIIALLFTVINPIMLYMKAKQQQLTNPAYKNEMIYTLTEDGIDLRAGNQEGGIPWDMIVKIVETNSLLILYTTRVNAFLWPKKDMASDQDKIEKFILSHIDPHAVKLPKRMRGLL